MADRPQTSRDIKNPESFLSRKIDRISQEKAHPYDAVWMVLSSLVTPLRHIALTQGGVKNAKTKQKAQPNWLGFLMYLSGSPTWARTRDLRINS
jgi:hypothetical protein